jgi:hypothetical protein
MALRARRGNAWHAAAIKMTALAAKAACPWLMLKQPFTAFRLCNTVTQPICWCVATTPAFWAALGALQSAWLVPEFMLVPTLA